jgi:hypothetical protein
VKQISSDKAVVHRPSVVVSNADRNGPTANHNQFRMPYVIHFTGREHDANWTERLLSGFGLQFFLSHDFVSRISLWQDIRYPSSYLIKGMTFNPVA